MPPIKKYNKELIIDIALRLIKEEKIDSLNARRIAKELNSSVQPIFHYFTSMDELKKIVNEKIFEIYKSYLQKDLTDGSTYRKMGLNHIKFAQEYPEYFKIIFMQQTKLSTDKFLYENDIGKEILKKGQEFTKLSLNEQKEFHQKVWIFTHGIACLLATKTISIAENEIEALLINTVKELLIGYKERNKK